MTSVQLVVQLNHAGASPSPPCVHERVVLHMELEQHVWRIPSRCHGTRGIPTSLSSSYCPTRSSRFIVPASRKLPWSKVRLWHWTRLFCHILGPGHAGLHHHTTDLVTMFTILCSKCIANHVDTIGLGMFANSGFGTTVIELYQYSTRD